MHAHINKWVFLINKYTNIHLDSLNLFLKKNTPKVVKNNFFMSLYRLT